MPLSRDPERILLVKIADLGDVLLSEPALRSIRTAFPKAEIDYLTLPSSAALVPLLDSNVNVVPVQKDFLSGHPSFDDVRRIAQWGQLARRLRRRDYDRVVILHHLTTAKGVLQYQLLVRATGCEEIYGLDNGRGSFLTNSVRDHGFGVYHEADYMLQVAVIAGGAEVDPRPRLGDHSPGITREVIDRPYALIAPAVGPYAPAREWPVERFAKTAAQLQSRFQLRSVVVGTSDATDAGRSIQKAVPSALDLTGKTDVEALIGLVRSAQLVITNDSFVGHLSAALHVRHVAIFGPSNPMAWRPYDSTIYAPGEAIGATRGVTLWKGLPCSPCFYVGHRLGRRNGCPAKTCLTEIRVESVIDAAEAILGATD